MKELMMNEDFSDVTLVTEDKKHIKANRNILHACSPVFKEMLKKEKDSSTIIYLRGIKFSEMESIMQFIYLGEATFYKERMDEFLAVAKSLEIKQLCNAETEKNDESDVEPLQGISTTTSIRLLEEEAGISDQIKKQSQEYGCSLNNKYECEKCHKTYSSSGALHTHRQSVHHGVKYDCEKCHKTYNSLSALYTHRQSVHRGVKYACDQCEHQATMKADLNKHIQEKHEGVKYPCDLCDHQSTRQRNLVRHIKSAHRNVVLSSKDYKMIHEIV